MPNISQNTLRSSDAHYIRTLKKLAESGAGIYFGLKNIEIHFPNGIREPIKASIEDLDSEPALTTILAQQTQACARIVLNNGDTTISVSRQIDFNSGKPSGPFDLVSYSTSEQQKAMSTAFADLYLAGESLFHDSTANLSQVIDDANQQHFISRDVALARLETLHARLLDELSTAQKQMVLELQQRDKALEDQAKKKELDREIQFANKMKELEEKGKKLDDERQKIDDRKSTIVRRELREKLKEDLVKRSHNFNLSSSTRKRRWFVFIGYIMLLGFFCSLVFLPASLFPSGQLAEKSAAGRVAEKSQTSELIQLYTQLGRQLLGSIGFVLTMGFFLRWMNDWSQRHADEELRMLQLDQDIDRASWVAEMNFEWKDEKNSPIPDALLNVLTSNLFGSKSGAQSQSMTPSDAVVKSLLSLPGGVAEIQFPGGKVSLGQKAVKHAAKSEE